MLASLPRSSAAWFHRSARTPDAQRLICAGQCTLLAESDLYRFRFVRKDSKQVNITETILTTRPTAHRVLALGGDDNGKETVLHALPVIL